MINKDQLTKSFNELLGKMNMNKQRFNIINEFSDARTREFNELSEDEMKNALQYLRKKWEALSDIERGELEQMQNMRKKFYSLCHRLNWTKNGKLDYKRINSWLKKSSVYKKQIDDHSSIELVMLLNQMSILLRKMS